MRLIDDEKIVHEYYKNPSYHQLCKVLNEAEEVKAIPIEFIKEQIAKTTDINNRDEFDVLYAGILGYLLKLWEKENETM